MTQRVERTKAEAGISKTQKSGEAPWSKTSDTEEVVCWAGVSGLEGGPGTRTFPGGA